MSGLLYPKKKRKKRRRKHPPSIIRQEPGICWLCMALGTYNGQHGYLEEHHVFPGTSGRKISEENGFKVQLCLSHHREGLEAVHNNEKNMRLIQAAVQREYERTHSREQWMDLMGRNYLTEEGEGNAEKKEDQRGRCEDTEKSGNVQRGDCGGSEMQCVTGQEGHGRGGLHLPGILFFSPSQSPQEADPAGTDRPAEGADADRDGDLDGRR